MKRLAALLGVPSAGHGCRVGRAARLNAGPTDAPAGAWRRHQPGRCPGPTGPALWRSDADHHEAGEVVVVVVLGDKSQVVGQGGGGDPRVVDAEAATSIPQ